MGEKEWRWEDGYKFYNARVLSDMLEAMKPGDELHFRVFIPDYDYYMRIRLMRDGYYEVSTECLTVRFNSWETIGTVILQPYCDGMKLSANISVYVLVLERKYDSLYNDVVSRVYDETGD